MLIERKVNSWLRRTKKVERILEAQNQYKVAIPSFHCHSEMRIQTASVRATVTDIIIWLTDAASASTEEEEERLLI